MKTSQNEHRFLQFKYNGFAKRGTGIPSWKNELKTRVRHYDVIFRVNNSKVFYLKSVNNTELITQNDLVI